MREASVPAGAPKKSRKPFWIGIGVIVPVLAGLVYLLLPKLMPLINRVFPERSSKQAISLNPGMSFRVLQIPFTEISYPGISPDGNWVAFPAADVSGKWDVYYMNTSGGEARRITADSSDNISQADISYDGARITYDRWNEKAGRSEICVVSSLGGLSKVITESGSCPRWRPDGQYIGYFVEQGASSDRSGKAEFWMVRPDGSDNHLGFAEGAIVGMGSPSFAWAPNGKSIVLSKSFLEGYQEIFLHNLETGSESQFTLDQKNIGDVCWTSDDNIIFSSDRSGNANLWITPAVAGESENEPAQLTKGSGPDLSMTISATGKRLLYLQRQQIGHIWIADSNCLGARQMTFDDHDIRTACLSPDGKQIAIQMFESNPLKPVSHIQLMDRDGNNRRQLSSGNEIAGNPQWSPDSRWICYSSRSTSEPEESSRVYLVGVATSGAPKFIGHGTNLSWVDASTIVLSAGKTSWLTTIQGTPPQQLYQDSTMATAIPGRTLRGTTAADGRYILFRDFHHGREGWWIVFVPAPVASDSSGIASTPPAFVGPLTESEMNDPERSLRDSLINSAKYLLSDDAQVVIAPDKSVLVYRRENGEAGRIFLPVGRETRVPGTIPGRLTSFNVSTDGKEIVYVDSRLSAKLVMVENLLK